MGNKSTPEVIVRLRDEETRIVGDLTALTLVHARRLPKKEMDLVVFVLRDNVIYRINSVIYHATLIVGHHDAIKSTFKMTSWPIDRNKLLGARATQSYQFDDLIFNTISLVDYFANYVGYLCLRKEGVKWNSLAKSARDRDNQFSTTQVAKRVNDHHRDWVDRLQGLRGAIFHSGFELTGATQHIHLGTGTTTYDAFVPERVQRELPFLQSGPDATIAISVGTEKLVRQVFDMIGDVLNSM